MADASANMASTAPLNITIMDVKSYIDQMNLAPVTSHMVHEPSSTRFHPEGMFSEEIFGPIGSDERRIRFGYIEHNAPMFHPFIFDQLLATSALYGRIMSGEVYATFDKKTGQYTAIEGEPSESDTDANTGFKFFMENFDDLTYPTSSSNTVQNRYAMLKKFRDRARVRHTLVLPAALRDVDESEGRATSDEINKLYWGAMAMSQAVSEDAVYFDAARWQLQMKMLDLYKHLENMVSGKTGFLQGGGYGGRSVALGTRNVLTAAQYDVASPDSAQGIKPNETQTGILQTAKGLQPVVGYYLRTIFFDPILGDGDTAQTALTNPKTLALEYCTVSALEKAKFVTSQATEAIVNRFKNIGIRWNPVTIKDEDDRDMYLCMVYDQGNRITLFRSIDDLKAFLPEHMEFDKKKVRPITWAEMLYLATYRAAEHRNVMITRYPVLEEGSTYPSKIHLVSTRPSREVKVFDLITQQDELSLPHYPIKEEAAFIDSLIVHSGSLAGLGGDYDGDTGSANYVMSDDANKQIEDYYGQVRSFLLAEGRFLKGSPTDIVLSTISAMSR